MPTHYAFSDFAIVIAGLIGARWLWRDGKMLMAGAMLCFAVPALIGTIRIASRQIDALAAMHGGSSALFGLMGVALLSVGAIAKLRCARAQMIVALSVAAASALTYVLQLPLAPVMGALLILGFAAGIISARRGEAGWLLPIGFAVLLTNSMFVRQASWLGEAAAWHAFHLLLAAGLVLLAMGAARAPKR